MTAAAPPPPTDSGVTAVAENLRAELESLVRIAARRPNLVLRSGWPGCPWSFSWNTNVVTVNPVHLESLAPDLCRGLALHEASHAAVTVLHRLLAEARLVRILPLLNTLEDIRIEVWMRRRFPGAAPWIRAYNDVFYGFNRDRPLPRSRQVQFLIGILESWWFGTIATATLPDVVAALEACHEPITAATSCQPPLDDDEAGILASQRAMWEIVRQRILPVWERLVALDRREGISRRAVEELERFLESTGCGRRTPPRGSGRLRPLLGRCHSPDGCRVIPVGTGARSTGSSPSSSACGAGTDHVDRGTAADGHRDPVARSPVERPEADAGADRYEEAWRRIAVVADRLGDELLRVLVPRRKLRWSIGHPWGPRLDLRQAMQFESDPRRHDALWRRPILPHRRDPAVLLLVDRSSSMVEDRRVDRALEGTTLITEVCRRLGVPAAVWSFAKDVGEDLGWDATVDGPARRRLGLLPDRCGGTTDMARALDAAGRAFATRQGDPKLLFVIGDGEPDEHEPTVAAVGRLEAAGIATVGLGLGPGTDTLARYFKTSVTGIPPERLVDHVADLLGRALLAAT